MDPSYNSFGSFDLNGGQPIASGAVMPAADNTKKKRGLIIGIVLAAVAVVSVVGFLLSRGMTGKKTAMQKLNEYSNYLLDGTESSENIGDELSWTPYYLISKVAEAEGNQGETYLGNLAKKFDAFVADYSKEYKEADFESADEYELVVNLVDGIKISLSAVKDYAVKVILTEEQLKESSVDYVEEYYNDFINSDNYILQNIAKANVNFVRAVKDGDTDAESYYRNEMDRLERRLVFGIVDNSKWLYNMISGIGDKE